MKLIKLPNDCIEKILSFYNPFKQMLYPIVLCELVNEWIYCFKCFKPIKLITKNGYEIILSDFIHCHSKYPYLKKYKCNLRFCFFCNFYSTCELKVSSE